MDYIPNHHAPSKVPTDLAKLKEYSAVILSDIGANTLLLHPDTFERSIATPNRLKLFREYVEQGGAFVMIGGYMSFTGIDGKAKYKTRLWRRSCRLPCWPMMTGWKYRKVSILRCLSRIIRWCRAWMPSGPCFWATTR